LYLQSLSLFALTEPRAVGILQSSVCLASGKANAMIWGVVPFQSNSASPWQTQGKRKPDLGSEIESRPCIFAVSIEAEFPGNVWRIGRRSRSSGWNNAFHWPVMPPSGR
jgi:hypothetical protein